MTSFVVRVKADQLDFVAGLILGDRLARALRHDQVRGEDAAQVRVGGDQVGHHVQACRRHAIRVLVGNKFQARIFGRKLLLEAFGALVQRTDARNRGDQRDLTLRLAVFRLRWRRRARRQRPGQPARYRW